MSQIPFIDLAKQQGRILPEIERRMSAVLKHGQYILGPEITELESKLATYCGVKHCITVSSGTDALLIALMSIGIQPGDEVITTPFTFIATGEVIALLGAKPVFVDIDPKTYNIDPTLIEAAITPLTKAIMPVSLYGQCADFDAINAIAKKHSLIVIEDACQSFGATYKGRKSCAASDIACTSFFPSKPLGCYGDGGACFTDSDEVATKIRQVMNHGQDRRYHHPMIGLNGRCDTLQAAVLLAKMEIFEEEVTLRSEIGAKYSAKFAAASNGKIVTPFIEDHNTSVYAQYTVQIDGRDALQPALQAKGVPTAVHYPVPLNLQPAFANLNKPAGSFPVSEAVANRVMSLPMHPYLAEADMDRIVAAVCSSMENN
ncbi:MAG: DegT/DnrJ/EryC1/StrS family aminotransferase [Geobacteraceae bacterium]|nr:DegT/DnrJ/EryC1/StrS family aminotransferase [Geobacteraceae bacterium]